MPTLIFTLSCHIFLMQGSGKKKQGNSLPFSVHHQLLLDLEDPITRNLKCYQLLNHRKEFYGQYNKRALQNKFQRLKKKKLEDPQSYWSLFTQVRAEDYIDEEEENQDKESDDEDYDNDSKEDKELKHWEDQVLEEQEKKEDIKQVKRVAGRMSAKKRKTNMNASSLPPLASPSPMKLVFDDPQDVEEQGKLTEAELRRKRQKMVSNQVSQPSVQPMKSLKLILTILNEMEDFLFPV